MLSKMEVVSVCSYCLHGAKVDGNTPTDSALCQESGNYSTSEIIMLGLIMI